MTTEQTVTISIGTSCLTRDLVWCECGRGISLQGKWTYCPNCGGKIDQGSYSQAVEIALKNGAGIYRNCDDGDLLKQLDAALAELAELRKRQEWLTSDPLVVNDRHYQIVRRIPRLVDASGEPLGIIPSIDAVISEVK